MNVRLVVGPIVALLLSSYAPGQQMSRGSGEIVTSRHTAVNAGGDFKQKLLHQIVLEEEAVRQAESAHAANVVLGRAYVQLGESYECAAQWERSEAALDHAVSLFRHAAESSEELADALSQLGGLHIAMGKLRESEKEDQEELKLVEKFGDRLRIARSWSDLAGLSLVQHKFEKARDFAQQALAEFTVNTQADATDRIRARYTLSMALCYLKDWASAIPLLKDAIDEAKADRQPSDFFIGLGDFLLGFVYWKSGNLSDAGLHMQEGTVAMSEQLGWGFPAYMNALKQYAKFLRENQQVEASNVVERRIRQAEAVVDVHSLQSSRGMLGLDGLR
jgi:tetratricopeptide (TPR) repeat protein